jgi:homopolymeric O-antigen transport system permease protein
MMAYYGLHPTAKLFLWPVLVIMLACLSCTIGMVLSALNVRYRDVKHVVPFLLQLWLFATPIVYPANMIPEYLRFYMDLNPLTGIVAAFRTVCVPQQHTDWASLGFSAVVILLLLFVSVGYFSKAEQSFGDVL